MINRFNEIININRLSGIRMRILWVTNVPLPEASVLMNQPTTPFGGWLVNASKELSEQKDIDLAVCFPNKGSHNSVFFQGNKIKYYPFNSFESSENNSIERNTDLLEIIDLYKPDIVHIFGTEYAHTLAMVNVCKIKGTEVVISIQGLVSIYAKHYMACLPEKVQRRFTIRDFIKQDNIRQQQQKFAKRGLLEIKALQSVNHVIGRTSWDKACSIQINPELNYYHCNETLRNEFYKYTWNIEKCDQYTIFLSQGSYPIKGLHFMLEAMLIILKKYPNVKLFVGGHDITQTNNIKQKLKISSYGKYIKDFIENHKLRNKIIFTGVLDEKDMCQRYLKSHVFVCPSSIENSPNSLGEAMILGVPSIASDVGGVADLLMNKKEGFIYQMDAPYMLAHYICEIFENKELALELSNNARVRAMKTHNRSENTNKMIEIYETIVLKV